MADASTPAPPGTPIDSTRSADDVSPQHTEPVDTLSAAEVAVTPKSVEPRFTGPMTAVLGVMAVAVVVFEAWPFWSRPAIDRLYYPSETALRIVERGMEFREAAHGAGLVERTLLWLGGDSPERDTNDFPEMLREVLRIPRSGAVAEWDRPGLQAHLTVLLGELGETNQCQAELESFRRQSGDPGFIAAIQRIYLQEPPGTARSNLGSSVKTLSAGWTQDRFAARLAKAEGRIAEARQLESRILARGQRWYRVAMASLAIDLGLVVGALAILALVWRRGGVGWRRGPDHSFAPWPSSDGIAVFCASLVVGSALAFLPHLTPNPVTNWVGSYWRSFLSAMPAVALVILCLLHPHGLRPGRQFGFEFSRRALNISLGGAIVIAGLHIVGWEVMVRVFGGLGVQSHWAETLNEYLLYDNWSVKLAVMMDMALFGPFVEELLFRGVLFGTLRKCMGPLAAAGLSSATFASIHHYSLAGNLAIFCFGFVCAMVYERTRDLGVCVAGHMLTNLMISLWEIAMLG